MKTYREVMVLDNDRRTKKIIKNLTKCYKELGLIDYCIVKNNRKEYSMTLKILCTDEFYINFVKELRSYFVRKGMDVYYVTLAEAKIG